MASKKQPKIASPGAKKADAAPRSAKSKKTAPDAPAASLSDLAPGADPSALIAKLCPVDLPGSIKILARYKSDRTTFDVKNEAAQSARGTMNATKKELTDKGWEKDAVSFAMKLSDMDPDHMQRVLAQTFVLCRSKVLDLPLGVINGTSGDLFDPDRVYKHGKLMKDAPAPSAEAAAEETKSQSDTERMADIFENGRASGIKGEHMKVPRGLEGDEKAAQTYSDGWTKGQAELLAKEQKPPADNVVTMQAKTPKAKPAVEAAAEFA